MRRSSRPTLFFLSGTSLSTLLLLSPDVALATRQASVYTAHLQDDADAVSSRSASAHLAPAAAAVAAGAGASTREFSPQQWSGMPSLAEFSSQSHGNGASSPSFDKASGAGGSSPRRVVSSNRHGSKPGAGSRENSSGQSKAIPRVPDSGLINGSNGSNGSAIASPSLPPPPPAMMTMAASRSQSQSQSQRVLVEQVQNVPPLVLALSSLGEKLSAVGGLVASGSATTGGFATSLLQGNSDVEIENRIELPATRAGVTHVRQGETCPSETGIGKVGCTWGCSCGPLESCFIFSSPLVVETDKVERAFNKTMLNQMQFRTASGQDRVQLGVCSLSAGWLMAASATFLVALIALIALMRAYLQHRENMLQLEDELNKLAGQEDSSVAEPGPAKNGAEVVEVVNAEVRG